MQSALASSDAPPVLYERPHWYACYTYSRREKRVARLLEERGIESFLPIRVQHSQWTDRVRKVELPMFPSYVFGRFRLGALSAVLGVPGVATIVRLRQYPTPIPDTEIENVRRAAEEVRRQGVEADVGPYVEEGDQILVMAGTFRGIEGVATERCDRTCVRIGLKAIGQGFSIRIRRKDLKVLDRVESGS